jgi:hypothetical protein
MQEELMEGDFHDCLRKPLTRDALSMVMTRWRQAAKTATQQKATGPNREGLEKMSLTEELHQEVSAQSIKSVLQHDLGKSWSAPERSDSAPETDSSDNAAHSAAFAAIEAATMTETEEKAPQAEMAAKLQGPSLTVQIGEEERTMAIEMAIGESLMVTTEGEPIEVGAEFSASLSYRDPAPGRNRMIPMQLKVRVGSCTPAEGNLYRCNLRIEDMRPAERWGQFVRVCRAALQE